MSSEAPGLLPRLSAPPSISPGSGSRPGRKPRPRGGQAFLDQLRDDWVLCAEGYLFELERRGYVQAGAFVPEAVLSHPRVVAELHRELVHAGSDVIEAFTYYGHREKLRLLGKEHLLEELNRQALAIAHRVADESAGIYGRRPFVAGNTCNTNVYDPADPATAREARTMFDEQAEWAADAGVDFMIAETISFAGEAELALAAIRDAGLLPVVTLAIHSPGELRDGVAVGEACRRLEQQGAAVVGLNCHRGPATMLPLLREVRAAVSCPVAALPVPFRTTEETPTFFHLRDERNRHEPEGGAFPTALDGLQCTRYEMADFAKAAHAFGVRYLGVCCGGAPHHVRAMAEALGRLPPASRYSPDMSKHFALGDDPKLRPLNRDFSGDL